MSTGIKYFVQRTKLGQNLPIYTEYRNGGNQCFTLIKKISGDCRSLATDLAAYLSESEIGLKENEVKNKWRIRSEFGHVWVNGNHVGTVRKFLESKGF